MQLGTNFVWIFKLITLQNITVPSLKWHSQLYLTILSLSLILEQNTLHHHPLNFWWFPTKSNLVRPVYPLWLSKVLAVLLLRNPVTFERIQTSNCHELSWFMKIKLLQKAFMSYNCLHLSPDLHSKNWIGIVE